MCEGRCEEVEAVRSDAFGGEGECHSEGEEGAEKEGDEGDEGREPGVGIIREGRCREAKDYRVAWLEWSV